MSSLLVIGVVTALVFVLTLEASILEAGGQGKASKLPPVGVEELEDPSRSRLKRF